MEEHGKTLNAKLKLHVNVLTEEKLKPRSYDVIYNLNCNCATLDLLNDISGRITNDLKSDIANSVFMEKTHSLFNDFVKMEEDGLMSIILVDDVDLFYMNLMRYVSKIIQKNVDLADNVQCSGYGVYRI